MNGLYVIGMMLVLGMAFLAQYAARRHDREQAEAVVVPEREDVPLVVMRMNAFGEAVDRVWQAREP